MTRPHHGAAHRSADQRYEVVVHRDVRIPVGRRDVTLSADLFLPAGAGPVPVLVTLLPYRRDIAAMNGSPLQRWFAVNGYASLLVDLRGTGSSDGTQRPPFDPGETDDALAVIDWAIGQSWCDGAVGMWGGSYGAMTAMRTAARRPAALRAIIAAEGAIDFDRDFVHPGGSRGAAAPLGIWALDTLFGQLLPPFDDYADPAEQARWQRRLETSPYLLDLFRRGPGDPAWAEGRIDASAIDVPALCVAGWRDLFVDGMIRAYERMAGPKRLIAGSWMHVMPHECSLYPIDFPGLALSWWDRWLRGVPNGAGDGPPVTVQVQGNRHRWLGFDSWPPGTAGSLDIATWQRTRPAEPDPAVGALSGLWATPAGLFGRPLDQHDDDARSLCYTSPELTKPLLIGGRSLVTLATSWPRVSVKLTDVDQRGCSTLVCAGLASTTDTAERGTVEVALTPTTYEIPAGHRLRLAIAPGDFPRVWPEKPADGWPSVTAVSLPIVDKDAGVEVDQPPPALPSGDQRAEPPLAPRAGDGPVWEIGTDPINERVSVRIALRVTGDEPAQPQNTHNRKHVLRLAREFVATAHRADPDASTVTSSIAATIDTETGHHVTVDAELTATSSHLTATGRVTVDGEPLLDRQWRA